MNTRQYKHKQRHPVRLRRQRMAAACALLTLAALARAQSACDDPQAFNIAPQALDAALLSFAQQARVSVLFPGEEYRSLRTRGVQGTLCRDEALDQLLAGLAVTGSINAANQLVIAAIEETPAAAAVADTAAAAPPRGLLGGLIDTLSGRNAAAQQEEAQARADATPPLEEITITGSRITRDGMETPTPVTSLQAQDIDTLAPGQLIEAMTLLPQFLSNSGPSTVGSVTGPTGSSFLNLRGIGHNRTLVLVNGRRVAPSNRLGTPDVALLPQAVISNVEIVTGGASAAYGSDAVSGVVNYVLDTDFSGIKGHSQYGFTQRGDNERSEWSFTAGGDLGARTHALFSLEQFEAAAVESYEGRDWFRNWGTVDVGGNGQPRVVASDVRSRLYTAGGLIRLPGSALHMTHFTTGGVPEKFVDGTLVGRTRQVGGTGFYGDIGSKEEDQTGQGSLYPDTERGSVFAYVDHEFNDAFTGFAQVMHGRNDVDFVGHGAHQESEPWQVTIYRDNAFLPASVRDIMVAEGRESFPLFRYASKLDLSRARGKQENEATSYTLGLEGDSKDLRINAWYQYSEAQNTFTVQDFPRLDRLYRAMDVVHDPASGQVVCRSTLSFAQDGCVPANPFGAGTMSDEAIAWILEGDMWRHSDLTQHLAEFTLDTELLDSRAPGPISVAAGASWRREGFDQQNGPRDLLALPVRPAAEEGYRGLPAVFTGGSLLQFSGIVDNPLAGSFDVWEIFGEGVLPLVRDAVLAEAFDLHGALRYAEYSRSGGVYAWKFGFDWRLNESWRLRATRSRDTRAATLSERFDRSLGGGSGLDPEVNRNVVFSLALGGNPDVAPEKADSWTAGLVFQPQAVPELALSMDWFDVEISDYITLLGAQRIIDECSKGSAVLCERIQRDPVTRQIERVENIYLNAAAARVTGVDLELLHRRNIDLFGGDDEQLVLRLYASYLKENSFTNFGETRDNAGTVELPRFSATALLGYRRNDFMATLSGRFLDDRVQFSAPVPATSLLDDNSVASALYFNLRLAWDYPAWYDRRYTLYVDVTNLLDRDPPVVATYSDFFGASAFVSGQHDALGRRYTLGVAFEF